MFFSWAHPMKALFVGQHAALCLRLGPKKHGSIQFYLYSAFLQ